MTSSETSPIEIRQPLFSECDLMWQIALDSKQHWGYDETFMQACREELMVSPEKLQNPNYYYQLGEWAGTVFGFYCLEKRSAHEMELDALFIAPDFIGKGLGTKLWVQMLNDAKSMGCKTLVIASDPYAEPFYLKMGANRVGEMASGSIPGRVLPLMEYRITAE